jgi:hypothetical protein
MADAAGFEGAQSREIVDFLKRTRIDLEQAIVRMLHLVQQPWPNN